MEHSKKEKASRGDPAEFRRLRQNGYEQQWFDVSTLLMSSQKAHIKDAIEDIQRQYDASDEKLNDLLKPFKVKEQIDVIRRYIPCVSVKRIGDRETWDRISEVGIPPSDVVSQMQGGDLIVCMVEVIYEKDVVRVSKASLHLLEQCLSARPGDLEIVIITELGIYATEAKSVVFETLMDRNIKPPKTVYHAAETNFEEIVAHRVNEAIKNICKLSKSLMDSIPEESDINKVINDAYTERTSQSNISAVARNVNLFDGNIAIGSASDAPQYYYNQFKIEAMKKQLKEKCTNTVIDQFGNTVTTNINAHILGRLKLSEISRHSFYFQDLDIDLNILVETISKMIGALIIGTILAVVFAPIFILLGVPLIAVFRIFSPVDVNDRTWRNACINGIVDQFRENKKKFTSEASSILVREFQSMKNGLATFRMRHDHSSQFKYDVLAYNQHRSMKLECKRHIEDEQLRQHVKKIVCTSDQTANIYVTEEAESIQYMSAHSDRIRIQQIPKSTEEDKRILKYLIKNRSKIDPLQRDQIKTIISKTSERLFTLHSNLSIIGPSPVKSSEHGENIVECPCIVFYCIGKGVRPVGEPYFPEILEGIQIDVREGFFVPFTCLSCSIGMEKDKKAGSFGLVANKRENPSRQGIITAAHVVVGNEILCTDIKNQKEHITTTTPRLVSPSDGDLRSPERSRIYGTVSDIHFGYGVDAAFVEKMDGSPVNLKFHINQGPLSAPMFNIDQHLWAYQRTVEKCGRTTGRTSGYLYTDGNDCKWEDGLKNFFVILENQYLISPTESTSPPFFKPGDSGCGVYVVENGQYHPIGIAIASKDFDGNVCFVTPIEHILQALSLEMCPENMEEDLK